MSATRTYGSVTGLPRGAPTGGGGGKGPSPLGPKQNSRFSGFLPLNYVICNFAACVLKLFAMYEDRGSLQHGKELMKILGAPLGVPIRPQMCTDKNYSIPFGTPVNIGLELFVTSHYFPLLPITPH